jgi:hypothetical protein
MRSTPPIAEQYSDIPADYRPGFAAMPLDYDSRMRRALLVCALILPAWLAADCRAQDDPLEPSRQELAALRIRLARAKLELAGVLDRLQTLREFLLAHDAAANVEHWTRQAQILAQERRQVARQRMDVEQQIAQRDAKLADLPAPRQPPPPPTAPDPPRWRIEYKIAVVPLDPAAPFIFVDPTRGDWLLDLFPRVDRRSIMVRGTIQNLADDPWRATFEVRLADKLGSIIGTWRYQTPSLGPRDLHTFEMRVPVTDVAELDRYQIGDLQSDRPAAR